MTPYKFYLFGAPRLERQGQLVPVDTRKALALLAYLLLTGEPQNRDTLAALLWPESNQKSARAALRRTLSTLRSALDEQILDFGRQLIAIHPGNKLWCDVIAYQNLVGEIPEHGHPVEQVCERCLPPLQQAADLYTADFMAGFSLRDSAAFDDWQFFETDRLRREYGGVLERLVRIHTDRGELQAALEVSRRWLSLDALNEAAHRALILLYAQNGQRNAALRQYRECVRIMDQELGVPPLEETTKLYEAVKGNRLEELRTPLGDAILGSHPQPEVVQPAQSNVRIPEMTDYPLIGRHPEWEALSSMYASIDQDGVFTVITGEVGIGKTHLAKGFITHLENHGANALSARCFAGENNLAFTPLIDLLRQGINRAGDRNWWQGLNPQWLSEISLLIPEISAIIPDLPPHLPGDDPLAQNRFYEAVSQVLTALVEGASPGIIFIDNLEWVNQSTLDLLAYYAHRLKNRQVLLLVAWSSATSPNTAGQEQLLHETIQQGYGKHLHLSPLDQQQAYEIIEQVIPQDQSFSPGFKHKLVELSGGLPYILLEYIQAVCRGEIDSQVEAEVLPVPTGLRGLLENRLAALSGPAMQILQAAAIIGLTFNIELLKSASGRSEEEIVMGIEELLAHNLIREALDHTETSLPIVRFDFHHQQVRDLVLEDLSQVRLHLLHRRTAEALEDQQRSTKPDALSAQIASHYMQAGVSEKASEYYFRAGAQDRLMHANADALKHFESALALGYPNKPDILVELGELYALKGDYPQAIQHFEAAAAYDLPGKLPVIEQKIGQVYLRLGQWEQAACHFEAALFDPANFPQEQGQAFEARVQADLSLVFHHLGQTRQAASQARQALDLSEAAQDPLALAQTHNLLAILARSKQGYEQALEHLELSLSAAQQVENPHVQIAALNNLALVQADLGGLEAAIETICQAIDDAHLLGDRHLEAALRSNYADMLRADGQTEAAMQQLKQSAAIFADIGQNVEDWQPEIWKLVEW